MSGSDGQRSSHSNANISTQLHLESKLQMAQRRSRTPHLVLYVVSLNENIMICDSFQVFEFNSGAVIPSHERSPFLPTDHNIYPWLRSHSAHCDHQNMGDSGPYNLNTRKSLQASLSSNIS